MFDGLFNHMISNGLPFHGNLQLDGTIHRYCKDGSKHKDEWYVGEFVSDKHFWCTYGSWSSPDKFKFRTWKDDGEISPEELNAYRNRVKHAEEQRNEQIKFSKSDLYKKYLSLPETNDHPYLKRKGIDISVKHDGDLIYLPLTDIQGKFQTVQTIDTQGNKRFFPGIPCSKCYYVFGNPVKDKENLIAEGFATAYSLHKATKKAVFCAFSAGNIPPLAQILKESGYLLTHAQDLGDAGDRCAEELKKLNIISVKPRFTTGKGKDFNDLYITENENAVFNSFSFPLCSINLIDILSSDIPDLEWNVEDLLMKGSINLFWAPPGLGKSTLCYALGMHATIGKTFLRKKIPHRLKVLYVDGEMTKREIKAKTKFIVNAMEMESHEVPDPEFFKVINFETFEETYGEVPDLYNPKTRTIIDIHVASHNPDIIFFDNLTSLTGMGDEVGYSNKEESWKSLNQWFKTFIKKNLSVVVIHHANKSGEVAGTGAISRTVQTEIELRPLIDNPEFHLAFEMHFKKARHIYGKAKIPKLIHFDPQETDAFYKQAHTSPDFYKICSHWLSLDLIEKPKK